MLNSSLLWWVGSEKEKWTEDRERKGERESEGMQFVCRQRKERGKSRDILAHPPPSCVIPSIEFLYDCKTFPHSRTRREDRTEEETESHVGGKSIPPGEGSQRHWGVGRHDWHLTSLFLFLCCFCRQWWDERCIIVQNLQNFPEQKTRLEAVMKENRCNCSFSVTRVR